MGLEVIVNMKGAVILLLVSVWALPAQAEPRDVLLDDFGVPVEQSSDAILPPRVPQSVTVPKPVKTEPVKKPAPAKKPEVILITPVEPDVEDRPSAKTDAVKKAPAKVVPPPASMQRVPIPKARPAITEKVEEENAGPAEFEVFGGGDAPVPPKPKAASPKAPPAKPKKPTILPPPVTKIAPKDPEEDSPPAAKEDKLPPPAVDPQEPDSSSRAKDEAPLDIFGGKDDSGADRGEGDKVAPAVPLPTRRPSMPAKVTILPTQPIPPVNDFSIAPSEEKRGGAPSAVVPPLPKRDEVDIFGHKDDPDQVPDSEAQAPNENKGTNLSGTEFEKDDLSEKKSGKPVAVVPPLPPRVVPLPGGAIMPPKFTDRVADIPAPKDFTDRTPVTEHLPIDIEAYIDTARTPKFIRINVDGQNIRNSPEFQAGRKDNIYDQNIAGSFYAVTRMVPTEEGVATGIFIDGEEKWVFMPWEKRGDFQYCESEACFADVTMGLEALAEANAISSKALQACGITGIDGDGRAVRQPLPRKIEVAALPPPVRTKPELQVLEKRLNREPKLRVQNDDQKDCVVDTRDQPRPNFRRYATFNERKRAFTAYMTPVALEVQEETGLPASVIIAQAALESGWGVSSLVADTGNIFGHSCWKRGTTKTFDLQIRGERKRIVGNCNRPRPHGGYFLDFRKYQDSVYAYTANLLSHPSYSLVRAAIKKAKPEPANWREVVGGLKEYDGPNPNYRNLLRGIITTNGLQKLENKKLCR